MFLFIPNNRITSVNVTFLTYLFTAVTASCIFTFSHTNSSFGSNMYFARFVPKSGFRILDLTGVSKTCNISLAVLSVIFLFKSKNNPSPLLCVNGNFIP